MDTSFCSCKHYFRHYPQTVKDTQLTEAASTENIQLFKNATPNTLNNARGISGSDSVINASSGVALVRNTNYTIDSVARTIELTDGTAQNGSFYNVSYRYVIKQYRGKHDRQRLGGARKNFNVFPQIGLVIAATALIATGSGFAFF